MRPRSKSSFSDKRVGWPMRILLLASAPRSLINFRGPLIEALLARGHEVHAAAPFQDADEAIAERLRCLGVAVHAVPLQRTGMSVPSDLRALLSLVRLLRRTATDVVIAYTIKPVVYGMIAASVAGVRQRFSIITGLGYLFADDEDDRRRLTQLLAKFLYRRAFARTSKVFFQNPDDEALFRRLRILPPGLPSVVVNGSGVDTSLFNVVSFPGARITFLLMAQLIGAKGIREYAAAAAEVRRSHPEARFLLAGGREGRADGIPLSELEAWERDGTLKWLGRLDDVRPAIADAHVLVLPSYYREGTPRSVLEAMAMGRPVITTDSPGCRETVRHGENGFLVPVRETAPLADAMRRFLEDPSMIERLGQAGRQIAEARYDVHAVNSVMLAEMGL